VGGSSAGRRAPQADAPSAGGGVRPLRMRPRRGGERSSWHCAPSACGARRRWSAGVSLIEGRANDLPRRPKALAGEAQNAGTIDEAIDSGHGDGLGGEERLPAGEARIGGQHDGADTVAGGDDAEEMAGLGGGKWIVAKFVALCGAPHKLTNGEHPVM